MSRRQEGDVTAKYVLVIPDGAVETAIRRAKKAESLGLTFREYQLEILERGRFLQAEDSVRIAEIIARRTRR